MKFSNDADYLMLKWGLGSVFIGITVLFLGKIVILVWTAGAIKIHLFTQHFMTGEFAKDLGHAIWEAMKGSVTGK